MSSFYHVFIMYVVVMINCTVEMTYRFETTRRKLVLTVSSWTNPPAPCVPLFPVCNQWLGPRSSNAPQHALYSNKKSRFMTTILMLETDPNCLANSRHQCVIPQKKIDSTYVGGSRETGKHVLKRRHRVSRYQGSSLVQSVLECILLETCSMKDANK